MLTQKKQISELREECDKSYVSPARVKLGWIYLKEKKHAECAELLAPFCDIWFMLRESERSIDLWKLLLECVKSHRFLEEWENFIDQDVLKYVDELFKCIAAKLKVEMPINETCECEKCNQCVISCIIEIGKVIDSHMVDDVVTKADWQLIN